MIVSRRRMNSPTRSLALRALFPLLAGCLLIVTGCNSVLSPSQRVRVDAITDPQETKLSGRSYRLSAKRALVAESQDRAQAVLACVNAGLGGKGLFEPPENLAPELWIEVNYGQANTLRASTSPAANDIFLQLTARKNVAGDPNPFDGPEAWDVKVTLQGVVGRLESAMPLLAMVAAEHAGTDTAHEVAVDIPKNSPALKAVRETAIKGLEAMNANRSGAPATQNLAPAESGKKS
jgi:hypothetical protein